MVYVGMEAGMRTITIDLDLTQLRDPKAALKALRCSSRRVTKARAKASITSACQGQNFRVNPTIEIPGQSSFRYTQEGEHEDQITPRQPYLPPLPTISLSRPSPGPGPDYSEEKQSKKRKSSARSSGSETERESRKVSVLEAETTMSSSSSKYGSSSDKGKSTSKSREESDDWTKEKDPEKRRRIQNRIAQRKFRVKVRDQKEEEHRNAKNEECAPNSYQIPDGDDIASGNDDGLPWGGVDMKYIVKKGHKKSKTSQQQQQQQQQYQQQGQYTSYGDMSYYQQDASYYGGGESSDGNYPDYDNSPAPGYYYEDQGGDGYGQ